MLSFKPNELILEPLRLDSRMKQPIESRTTEVHETLTGDGNSRIMTRHNTPSKLQVRTIHNSVSSNRPMHGRFLSPSYVGMTGDDNKLQKIYGTNSPLTLPTLNKIKFVKPRTPAFMNR